MNVLVLNPPSRPGDGFVREGRCEQRLSSFQYVMLPVSLTYIAAVLRRDGHAVRILDAIADPRPWDELTAMISAPRPDLVIFNISTVTYAEDVRVAAEVRRLLPAAHFAAIGVHVTTTSRATLQETVLDSVVRGEPELICSNLAKAVSLGSSLREVKGLSFKADGEIVENPPEAPIEDLDALPFPARDLVDNAKYTLPVINQPYTLLVPSRGCPYSCSFCTAHIYYGKQPRFRSVENVIAEIREIVERFGVRNITMWSDTFTLKKEFVLGLAQAILKEGLEVKWMCNSRVDTLDEEMLDWMRRSGCIGISFGIESADPEVLKNVKKGIQVAQIEKAVRATNRYGIQSLAHVIFGLPGDTKESILRTIRFIKRIRPTFAQFYCAVPFPGTPFYQQALDQQWLTTRDWSQFEINRAIISTPQLRADELQRLKKRAYVRFYLSPTYILGRLARVRSLSDLWLNVRQAFNFMRSWVFER